jgi:flagellar hook-basal body complex protein FliE
MMSTPITGAQRLVPGLIEKAGKSSISLEPNAAESTEKFSDVFANLINSANEVHQASGEAERAFLAGEPIELHEVMIKSAQAGVATDLVLEIRNKLVNAYDDLLRMPM